MTTMRQHRHTRHRFGAGHHDTWRGMRGWSNAPTKLSMHTTVIRWEQAGTIMAGGRLAGLATLRIYAGTPPEHPGDTTTGTLLFSGPLPTSKEPS